MQRKSRLKQTGHLKRSRINPKRDKPRRGRIRLSRGEWAELRKQVAERAEFRCQQEGCGTAAPLEGHPLSVGQAHHIRYRSRGGDDSETNLLWLCPKCHHNIHFGEKPCPRKDGPQ